MVSLCPIFSQLDVTSENFTHSTNMVGPAAFASFWCVQITMQHMKLKACLPANSIAFGKAPRRERKIELSKKNSGATK